MIHPLAPLAVVSSLLLGACSDRAPAPTAAAPADPGQMTVTGTAVLEVEPDYVDLTMTITADGKRPAAATADAQNRQRELVVALAALGVEGSNVKLSHVNLRPVYVRDSDELKVATFRAEIIVTASTKRFDQIGAMMEAGANSGASAMTSEFRRSDLPELKKKVRVMALEAAKAKAAQTATSLDITLGRVVSVEEGNATNWSSRHLYPNYIGNNPGNTAGSVSSSDGASPGGTLQKLSLDVTIRFQLAKEA